MGLGYGGFLTLLSYFLCTGGRALTICWNRSRRNHRPTLIEKNVNNRQPILKIRRVSGEIYLFIRLIP